MRDIYAFGLTLFKTFIDINEYEKNFKEINKNNLNISITPLTTTNKNTITLMNPIEREKYFEHIFYNRSRREPSVTKLEKENPDFYNFFMNYNFRDFNSNNISKEFHHQMHSTLLEMMKKNGTHDSLEKITADCLNSNPEHRPRAEQLAHRLHTLL